MLRFYTQLLQLCVRDYGYILGILPIFHGVKTAKPSRFQDVTSGNVIRYFQNLISVSHTDMFEIL